MTRTELDARSSVMRVVYFYNKVAEIFNCLHFVPDTQILPDLHSNNSTSITLNLGEYRCTIEKEKDFMVWVRPRLDKIFNTYELGGAGAGKMRSEDEDDYVHFDITRCEAGDNRAIFENENEVFLLYWWHYLDEKGFVQLTLCIMGKFHRAHVKYFALVSNQHTKTSWLKRANDVKVDIVKNMAMVGYMLKTLGYVTIMSEMETWEKEQFEMEDKLMDMELQTCQSANWTIRIERIKRRISRLEDKIKEGKKGCKELSDWYR